MKKIIKIIPRAHIKASKIMENINFWMCFMKKYMKTTLTKNREIIPIFKSTFRKETLVENIPRIKRK